MEAVIAEKFSKIKDVDIDESGKFKYVLLKIHLVNIETPNDEERSKFIVRGYKSCNYHGDIYDKFIEDELAQINGGGWYDSECVGGGRIIRKSDSILVFGYSQGYGQADHSKTVEILQREFPNLIITWNNEGY